MPYWDAGFLPRIWPPYPSRQQEIAHGSTTTDAEGKYTVSFVALPDNNVPKSSHPTFVYRVIADVTDLNGETISGITTLQVAYEAVKILLSGFLNELHTDSVKSISVFTTNMNDSFVKSEIKLSIYKLNAPDKVSRLRYWEKPDQFIMSKNEFTQLFPLDEYADENNSAKWTKGAVAMEFITTSSPDGKINQAIKSLEPGWYSIEVATKDRFGDSVAAKSIVQLFNDKVSSNVATAKLSADKLSAEAGQTIKYSLKTNLENINLIQEVVRNRGTVRNSFNTSRTSTSQELEIDKDDVGTIVVKTVFVKDNRIYNSNLTLNVSSRDKLLDIEYITYRDKTLPDNGEKWKVKIKGSKGEKIAAELLTTMYDASLDVLARHHWSVPSLWDRSVDATDWTGYSNFSAPESENYFPPGNDIKSVVNEYDQLAVSDGGGHKYANGGVRPGQRMIAFKAPAIASEQAMSSRNANLDSYLSGNIDASQLSPNPIEQYRQEQTSNNPPAFIPRKNFNETAFFFP